MMRLTPMPPSINLLAEQQILGALLNNGRDNFGLFDQVRAEHFADPIHTVIFKAIKDRGSAPFRSSDLWSQFQVSRALDDIGGPNYLHQLADAFCEDAWQEAARRVVDMWDRRRLADVAEHLGVLAQEAAASSVDDHTGVSGAETGAYIAKRLRRLADIADGNP